MIRYPRGKTTSLSKRGQILAYAILKGSRRMKLSEIAANSQISVSTCSDIINKATKKAIETGHPDLCAEENLAPKPNSKKGCNTVLILEKERRLIEITLSSGEHCRMPFAELAASGIAPVVSKKNYKLTAIAGLNIYVTTVKRVLESDSICCRKSTKKPLLSAEQKTARLEFCLQYRYLNWQNMIFTDESYFEAGNLRSRRARSVLQRPEEADLARNIN